MIVRVARAADAAALTACLEAAYAPYLDLGLPPVTQGVADDIADHHVWVAEIDGFVRGGIVVMLQKDAHIVNLAVHPDAGGHGIGGALMTTAQQAAIAAGFDVIHLATHTQMTATQDFYRKRGWIETGRAGQKVYFKFELNIKEGTS